MNNKQIFNSQKGQALLIVVLVMVIALTVGLSIASRSIINLRTSTDEANSQKAFSAAEAGIERALKLNATPMPDFSISEDVNIKKVEIKEIKDSKLILNNGNPIPQDDGFDLWLVDHKTQNGELILDYSANSGWHRLNDAQDLTFYWGESSSSCPNEAALEVIIITKDIPNPRTIQSTRYTFDPCSSRSANNNFTAPEVDGGVIEGKNFAFGQTISIPKGVAKNKGILVRFIPLYKDAVIGVKGCASDIDPDTSDCEDFPEQGKIIESTGEAGGAVRKVVYYKGYRKLPSEFFQYVLFSP